MLFEEAYEEFKIYASKRHKKQGFETLTQNFNKHVLPYFKNIKITELNIKKILNWQNDILKKNFKNNYNKNIYSAFNSFLKYCVLNEYISENYLNIVGSFQKKIEFKEYQTYTLFQFYNFRKGEKDKIYKYFFDFLFHYGPRSGEAMALKYSDIKWRYAHIGPNMQRRGKRERDTGKTKNAYRTLKLSLLMVLKIFILKCYYVKKYGDDDFDYFVFGGKTPLSPTSIRRHKTNACTNRKIFEIKTHEFRHSYATRKIKMHVPIQTVSKNLGHSSIAITLDIYVHDKKKEKQMLFSHVKFFETLTQNFKKFLQSIITHYV